MKRFWNFNNVIVKNEAGEDVESAELRIDGDIVSNEDVWFYEFFDHEYSSPNQFRDELAKYADKDITVWIDSYGGDVFAASGIYNALKEHKGAVSVKIDGKAMSAASVIAMAGDKIEMSPVGLMMIHNPASEVYGDAREQRQLADVLDEIKELIMNAYVLKTGKSRDDISAMMDKTSWMSANQAVEEGFADGILYAEAGEINNSFMYQRASIQNTVDSKLKQFLENRKEEEPKDETEPPIDTYKIKIESIRRKQNGLT